MANPLYPDVPSASGVPSVLRYAGNAVVSAVTSLVADTISNLSILAAGPWGIYDENGALVIEADTVAGLEFGREYQVATAPQEQGSFQSYNKVQLPYEARVRLMQGGEVADRTAFFSALDKAVASLSLYSILTPEVSYTGANVLGYRYIRGGQSGATLIGADVRVQEVRVSAKAQFSNTAQPQGQATQSTGSVQAVPATPAEQSTIAFGGLY